MRKTPLRMAHGAVGEFRPPSSGRFERRVSTILPNVLIILPPGLGL